MSQTCPLWLWHREGLGIGCVLLGKGVGMRRKGWMDLRCRREVELIGRNFHFWPASLSGWRRQLLDHSGFGGVCSQISYESEIFTHQRNHAIVLLLPEQSFSQPLCSYETRSGPWGLGTLVYNMTGYLSLWVEKRKWSCSDFNFLSSEENREIRSERTKEMTLFFLFLLPVRQTR